ncbi:hypothetical protein TURU_082414 [Turdus rufiventris]|nr:hypothetical protein TURU_082414 [Turdus rufiventris]
MTQIPDSKSQILIPNPVCSHWEPHDPDTNSRSQIPIPNPKSLPPHRELRDPDPNSQIPNPQSQIPFALTGNCVTLIPIPRSQIPNPRSPIPFALTGNCVTQCTSSEPVAGSRSTTSSLSTSESHFFRYSVSSWEREWIWD